MSNAQIWPGSSSFFPGATPFGFYDYDYQFQTDADKVAHYCATRLGFPITDIELQDVHFYTAFEIAVTTYGNEVYAQKVQQDYLSLEGSSTGSNLNNTVITPNFAGLVRVSQQYGEEAGVGGQVTYYKGELNLVAGQQDYNLTEWAQASASLTPGDTIEIKRLFYEPPPAISQLYSPNMFMGGLGGVPAAAGTFGFGGYANYLLMPTSLVLQNAQAIELQNSVLFNNYSFEIVNNNLRLFPIPGTSWDSSESGRHKVWFEYIKNSERNNPYTSGSLNKGVTSNVSNAPYTNPTYTLINSIGRAWIFEYTLALAKEMLGNNRGKYSNIPIPGDNVTLNYSELYTQATTEKQALIERLRNYLLETGRDKLLERRASESEYKQKELSMVPFLIYVG